MRKFNVVRKGKGKPILLIHGLLSDHRQILPLLSALDEYECFCVDLIGCGETDKLPSIDIVEENAEYLRKLCDKHGIDTVVAFSVGGLVAIELQLKHTVFIASFCTNPLDAGPLKKLQSKKEKIKNLIIHNERIAQKIIEKYVKEMKGVPGMKEASMECAAQYMLAAMRNYTEDAKKAQTRTCDARYKRLAY